MKEYSTFENRETDWLSKQKQQEKETLDLDEAKNIKESHTSIHQKANNTSLVVYQPKHVKDKESLTLIQVLGIVMLFFTFALPLLFSLISLASIMPLFK